MKEDKTMFLGYDREIVERAVEFSLRSSPGHWKRVRRDGSISGIHRSLDEAQAARLGGETVLPTTIAMVEQMRTAMTSDVLLCSECADARKQVVCQACHDTSIMILEMRIAALEAEMKADRESNKSAIYRSIIEKTYREYTWGADTEVRLAFSRAMAKMSDTETRAMRCECGGHLGGEHTPECPECLESQMLEVT